MRFLPRSCVCSSYLFVCCDVVALNCSCQGYTLISPPVKNVSIGFSWIEMLNYSYLHITAYHQTSFSCSSLSNNAYVCLLVNVWSTLGAIDIVLGEWSGRLELIPAPSSLPVYWLTHQTDEESWQAPLRALTREYTRWWPLHFLRINITLFFPLHHLQCWRLYILVNLISLPTLLLNVI